MKHRVNVFWVGVTFSTGYGVCKIFVGVALRKWLIFHPLVGTANLPVAPPYQIFPLKTGIHERPRSAKPRRLESYVRLRFLARTAIASVAQRAAATRAGFFHANL
jgi:hypothetical protein